MTTRADFYIGRGESAEWIGSIAMDGNPGGVSDDDEHSTGGFQALTATTEEAFRAGVQRMRETRDDFTAPEGGWPWPWSDSATTDYAYAFDVVDDQTTVALRDLARRYEQGVIDPSIPQEEALSLKSRAEQTRSEADSRKPRGAVFASQFGGPWWEIAMDRDYCGEPLDEDGNPRNDGPAPVFPDMAEHRNVRWDRGGGAIII